MKDKISKVVIVLVTVLALVLCPMQGTFQVKAATDVKFVFIGNDSFQYEEVVHNNKTYAKILKANIGNNLVVNLPSKLDGLPVGELGEDLFANSATEKKYKIETVTIPSTVYNVGVHAFYYCDSLKQVIFNNVAGSDMLELKIGRGAFYCCKNLETVEFRDNIEKLYVYEDAFFSCEKLKISEIKSDAYIAQGGFHSCGSLENLTFKGETTLCASAFGNAFKDTEKEKKLTFEKDVTMSAGKGKNAPLANCCGLTELEFCGKITLNCDMGFYNNTNLKKITWGNGIEIPGFNLYESNMGRGMFSGCDSLKTFEFKSGEIDIKDFWGTIEGLEKIIYDGDITLNYWFDAKDIIFKGNVTFADDVNAVSTKTKNIYFYEPDQNLDKLSASNINIYGIKGSAVEDYVNEKGKENNCAFANIISNVDVDYDKSYILDNGPIETLNPEDIHLKVYASYKGDGGEKKEIPQSVDSEKNIGGYTFSYNDLKANLNNDFKITFSGITKEIQILLQHRTLEEITAEINPTVEDIVEGENQLKKDHITVTAHYNHGEDKVVTEDCVIEQHEIVDGDNNQVTITYRDPYADEGEPAKETTVTVKGRKKAALEPLEVTYDYGNNKTGVVVGTKINYNNLKVKINYDNGTYNEVSNFAIEDLVIKNVGQNEIKITDPTTKITGMVTVMGVPLKKMVVNFADKKYVNEDVINVKDIQLQAFLEDGTIVENIDETDICIEPKTYKTGKNIIKVSYGNLSEEVIVYALPKEVDKIEVKLKEDVEKNGFVEGVKLDTTIFDVVEYYNNGKCETVSNPEIEILPYDLKEGSNTITVVYLGKEYPVHIEVKRVKYVEAIYVGTRIIYPGDRIDLSEIKVMVYFSDNTKQQISAEEYDFADAEQSKVYVKTYGMTINVTGISEQETTLAPITTNPVVTEVPTQTPENIVSAAPITSPTNPGNTNIPTKFPETTSVVVVTKEPENSTPPVMVTKEPANSTPPAVVTKEPEKPTPTVTETVEPIPTIPVPTQTADTVTNGVVFLMNCNAKAIKLAEADKKITKAFSNRTTNFTFTLENAAELKYQIVKKGNKVKKTAWKTVKNNILTIKKETKLSQIYFKYKDKDGKEIVKKTVYFAIDKSQPKTNIKNVTYYKKVKVTFKDSISGIKKATLDGKKIKSGEVIKKKGSHKLVIIDNAGNKITKKFKIKK